MRQRLAAKATYYRADTANRLAEWRSRRRATAAARREAEWRRLSAGPAKLVTVKTRRGRITFDSRDSVIGMHLFRYGAWEDELMLRTTRLLREKRLLRPGRTILIDAGANIGTTTLGFLSDETFERAVAVEPEPTNFAILHRNIRQNGLDRRVRCLPLALGGEAGTVELELSNDNFGDHRVRASDAPGAYGESDRLTRIVPMERLDDVLSRDAWASIASIGLLWIDVQGFECEVLKGAPRLLASGVPVEMELWPYGIARSGTPPEALLGLLTNSFTSFVDLRDDQLPTKPIDEIVDIYRSLVGPFDDTEVLLFNQ